MAVKRFELIISNVLRIGALVSGLLIFFGLCLFLVTGDSSYPTGDTSLHWIIYGDPFFSPSHIMFFGYILLVLTPILSVTASVLAYFYERDWIFFLITGFVLTVLVFGIILGLG